MLQYEPTYCRTKQAGGNFTEAGGVSAKYIAKFNGTSWSPVGSATSLNNSVGKMFTFNNVLYVAGYFTSAGGASNTAYIAKWDGSTWSSVGFYLSAYARTVRVINGALYVGGSFLTANSTTVNRIVVGKPIVTVTGSVVQDGSPYTSITLAYKGDTIVLDRSPDQWSVMSTSTGVTLS